MGVEDEQAPRKLGEKLEELQSAFREYQQKIEESKATLRQQIRDAAKQVRDLAKVVFEYNPLLDVRLLKKTKQDTMTLDDYCFEFFIADEELEDEMQGRTLKLSVEATLAFLVNAGMMIDSGMGFDAGTAATMFKEIK